LNNGKRWREKGAAMTAKKIAKNAAASVRWNATKGILTDATHAEVLARLTN
jgi:hypothetical protein